jgi:hypothetical protein
LTRAGKLVFWAGTQHDTLRLATDDYLRLAKAITGKLIRPQPEAEAVG